MALNIGELVAYVKVDHAGVGKGIQSAQQEMRRGMDRAAADAKTGGEKAGKAAGDGLVGGIKGSVGKLTGIVVGAFAVEKVVAGLRATKDAASDLNETTSMAGQIFGANAKAMQDWAKTGPRVLGLSTEATLRQSAAFADMLLQIGYTEDGAAAASKTILQMAADLGSFKNLRTEDVLERISAGFRGEYDSLQLLIPNISAARVQSEAMAATGKKNAESLTAQEKAAATLAIVQKDGARAMGDFARTADGEANASKTAAAATEDLKAKIGQGLLPAYTALVVFGRDELIPFLSATVDKLGDAADAAEPVADGVGELVRQFRQLPEPLQASTLGLIALVALRGRVASLGASIKTNVTDTAKGASSAVDTMRLHLMYAGDTAKTAENRFVGAGKAIGYTAGVGLRGAASGMLSLLGGPWGLAFTGAVAVLGVWMKRQREAKQRVEELTAAIKADSGALGENTREATANALEKSGAAKAAKELGLNLADLTDASLGNADAQERVEARLRAMQRALADSGASSDAVGIQYADLGKNMQTVRDAIGGQNDELKDARAEYERHAEMVGVDKSAQSGLADQAKTTTGALEDQKDTVKDLAEATLDLVDAQISASDAQIGYQQALSDVDERLAKRKELEAELAKATTKEDRARITKELKEYAKGLDLTTKAGQENQSLLNDLAKAAHEKAEKDLEAGASLKDLRTGMSGARKDFLEAADKLGISGKAAEKMADKFGITKGYVDDLAKSVEDLPASKQIKVEAETEAAKAALATLKAQLAELDTGATVVVTAQGRFVDTGLTGRGGKNLAGGSTRNADGGYYPASLGARMFAAGEGIKHTFNEPETGGESFIPHAPGKRGKALPVLAQTADLFGLSLAPKSVTNTNRMTVIHRGNVIASDPAAYAESMRQQQRLNALTGQDA